MKFLIDSDFLFGLFIDTDVHHVKCKKLYQLLKNEPDIRICALVEQETATVISRKASQERAKFFLDRFKKLNFTRIEFSNNIEAEAWNIFKSSNQDKTSFVDCANLAIAKEYVIDKIVSFDKFYPDNYKVTL